MVYKQMSLFQTEDPDGIQTVDDFAAAAHTLFCRAKQNGWIRPEESFLERQTLYFSHCFGGSAPDVFAPYEFYDYSPKGVRLQKFGKPYMEIKFSKQAILNAIKRGDYH